MFIEEALPYPDKCHTEIRPLHRGDEDVEFGLCLQSIGVLPGNSNDHKGRYLFHIRNPLNRTMSRMKDNYTKWQAIDSWLPQRSISFHYVSPEHLYVFELLTTYLRQTDGRNLSNAHS